MKPVLTTELLKKTIKNKNKNKTERDAERM